MKLFACHDCQQIVFFESVSCTRCGRSLVYLPDQGIVSGIEQTTGSGGEPLWRALTSPAQGALYRLCRNHREHGVCNWAVPATEPHEYCRSCRLTRVVPNLGDRAAKDAWHRLEIAKRRLLYTLLGLGLPVETKAENPEGGVAFEFLKDEPGPDGKPKVFTGHAHGVITINIAEADDTFREKMRVMMGEAYRTVLGHFRHEIGHYYWARLLEHGPRLGEFRARFGDERADYDAAQRHHYSGGPPPDWQDRFVSAYASMHPWEDWAETWAHYLHMVDTLETARAYGLSLRPAPACAGDGGRGSIAEARLAARRMDLHSFDDLLGGWFPLTMAMNSLNRSLGTNDCYPFVLSEGAIAKLRFVHDVVEEVARAGHGA
jgi:hypothetical protein